LYYKRGNSGKEKERKLVLLSGAGAIVACTSSPLWLAKIGLDSDRRKNWALVDAFFGAKRLLLNVY
jgi:hypothetical protein